MAGYLVDLVIFSLLVIGITAFNGVLTNSIGEKLFGGKQRTEISSRSEGIQSGWKSVGGRKKH
ncbi:hypothetical protein ACFVHQ_05960 [Actinomycetes bacterium NPDC127524]